MIFAWCDFEYRRCFSFRRCVHVGSRGAVCLRLHCSTFSRTEIALQKLRISAHFLPPARAQLTPYILMTGKPVDAMERLAVEGKADMLKTSHGSCRRRRDGNHLRSLRLGLGFFPYDLVHSFFCLLS
jgi:hypothetical protein